jgi:hypothetical protein
VEGGGLMAWEWLIAAPGIFMLLVVFWIAVLKR